jgi:hypothetical protein
MTAPGTIEVSGGPAGVEARLADLRGVADALAGIGVDCAQRCARLHLDLLDIRAAASAALDPFGWGAFETCLLAALDGPIGLTALAAECAVVAAALETTCTVYQSAERAALTVLPAVDAGLAAIPALLAGLSTGVRTGSWSAATQRALTADPAVLGLFNDAGRFGLGSLRPTLLDALAADDGHPVVSRLGPDTGADAGGAPRSIADLVAALGRRNLGEPGEIDVRRLVGPDGRTRFIVDVPGTKSWSILPTADVTSLATDLRAIGGEQTSYERGVLAAMSAAGVGPDDPVLLVGHSEGGMVAVNAAIHCAASHRFRISHVLALGSPLGETAAAVPRGVSVLALENTADVVPALDGSSNAPTPQVTTVRFDQDDATLIDNHDPYLSYLAGARMADRAGAASVVAYREGVAAFLSASTVQTTSFLVKRGY